MNTFRTTPEKTSREPIINNDIMKQYYKVWEEAQKGMEQPCRKNK